MEIVQLTFSFFIIFFLLLRLTMHKSFTFFITALLLITVLDAVYSAENTELKYQIILPGKLKADGAYSPARICNMYRVSDEYIFPGMIHIKTKNSVILDKDKNTLMSAGLMNNLSSYNIKKIRGLVTPDVRNKILKDDPEGLERIYEVAFSDEFDPYDVCIDLMNNPEIEYACPVFIRHTKDYTPNDPEISKQWAIGKLQMLKAWDITKGSKTVKIAIVDSGTDWNHPDLKGNTWTNPNEIPNNNIDDDKNGKIDDIVGWDLIGNSSYNDISMGVFKEDNDPTNTGNGFHGTHVAGCASAATDNSTGIAGIGFNCSMLHVKCAVNGDQAGIFRGYDGLLYAASVKADIINCSWGGPGYSPSEQDIINTITKAGCLVVVAAANDYKQNIDEEGTYPAAYDNVLCVGATASNDQAAAFSNIGYLVKVYSPGQGIYATMPSNKYQNMDGTSMATPVTSGICGLVKSLHPNWEPKKIIHQIRSTSENVITKDTTQRPYYYGRSNALRALEYNSTNPSKMIPGVEIDEVSFSSGDAITDYNPVKVNLKLKNYLGDANDLRMKIKPQGGSITVSNSSVVVGKLASMEEKQIELTVQLNKMSAWYAGYANLYITFESESYKDYQLVKIPVILPSKNNFSGYYTFRTGYAPTWNHAFAVNQDMVWACGTGGAAFNWRGGAIKIANASPVMGSVAEAGEALNCVYAFDVNRAYFGSGKSSNQTAKVYRTLDGGATWANTDVSSITPFVIAIHFFTEDYSIILGNPKNNVFGIGVSQDAGVTWKAITNAPAPNTGETGNPGSAFWLKTYGWFGTTKGRIFRTTDMGNSWKATSVPKAAIIYQMVFKDINNGIAIYAESTNRYAPRIIASTSDGGASWKGNVFNFGAINLVPVYLYSNDETNLIIMLCSTGQVYGSTDNGYTWNAVLSTFHGVIQAGAGAFFDKNKIRLWDFGESIGYLDFAFIPKVIQKTFDVNLSSVNFDTVDIGINRTRNISINHTGNYDINLNFEILPGTGSDPEEFKLMGEAVDTLEPNKSLLFRVKFSPTKEGLRTATLKITSDGKPAEYNIPLSGIGKVGTSVENYLFSEDAAITLSPNPAHDFTVLSFESNSADKISVSLFDFLGRQITSFECSDISGSYFEKILPLQNYPSGVYYLQINTGLKIFRKKLLID